MLGFGKTDPFEAEKVALFTEVLKEVPYLNRFSYRKKGRFEVIFDGKKVNGFEAEENQASFNLLAHIWLKIWGNEKAQLHVGLDNVVGKRLEIDAMKIYLGHKYTDHDRMVDEIVSKFKTPPNS